MTWDLLIETLVQDLQLQVECLVPTASLADVGLDSLAAVELAETLGSKYGVQVFDYEILDTDTLAALAQLVVARWKP